MKKLLLGLMLLPMLGFSKEMKTIELSKDNSISFNQEFTSSYVAKKQVELIELARKSQEEDLFIVLYSPGGSISAGQLFIDTAKALNKNIHTITVFSASMSYQTVQALGKRYILPSGTLMSHRGYASGLSGQVPGELNARVDMLLSMVTQMEKVSAERVGITLKEYKKEIRDELWLIGEDAVKQGHADEVVLAKCDKSLSGIRTETFQTLFGPVQVDFSNCPIVAGPVDVRFGNSEAINYVQRYYNNITNFVKSGL